MFTIWYMWAVCITFIIEELEKKLQNALHDTKVIVMLKWINWCNESLMILVGSGVEILWCEINEMRFLKTKYILQC